MSDKALWVEVEGLTDYIKKLEVARNMLGDLVYHLLRNYKDDMWSSSTQGLLEEINDYLGEQPIVWNIEDAGMDALDEYDEH